MFQGVNPSEIDALDFDRVQELVLVFEQMREREQKRMENMLRKVLSEVMR